MLWTNAIKLIHEKNYKNMSCVNDIEVDNSANLPVKWKWMDIVKRSKLN